jgi:signal transduction histidine kinase
LLGFGAMILLTAVSALENWRRADEINATVLAIHESHRRSEQLLRDIENGIYVSGLLIRDFLLDQSQLTTALHRQELIELRSEMASTLSALREVPSLKNQPLLDRLNNEIDSYWDTLDPVFDWTPQQKTAFSLTFLRRQVLPRREAALDLARVVETLTADELKQREVELGANMAEFRKAGRWTLFGVVALATGIALASILRIAGLERRSEQQHLRTEQAEKELRRLSQKLVHAQEDESRRLSRELHDEVGQMLTALRVELGNLDKLRNGPEHEFTAHLEDAKSLAVRTLSSVRNLASALRPSVLDDLGLGPALQWQAREFSRRTGVPVEVVLGGLPVELPDLHRTCVYRVVQEALTNCARHADAQEIRVALHTEADQLSLSIQDDGRGLPVNGAGQEGGIPSSGLGLVGMEERVHELGGSLEIRSTPGKGTLIKVTIPLPAEVSA